MIKIGTHNGEAMENKENKHWYVLYTKPRWEKKIASRLHEMNIECYCPLNRVERQWSDRKKVVLEPLFTCYLFVRLADNELAKPLSVNGVLNFIQRMKKPAPVRDHEIDDIRKFLSEYQYVQLEKIDVEVDDEIEITRGLFMEQKGYITDVRGNYVKVAIKSLGYSLVASVDRKGIRKIQTTE